MYSSENLERFYFQYRTEALPHARVPPVLLFEEQGTLRTDSVDAACPQAASEASRQDRDLSNRPDTYKRTGVAGAPLYLAERGIRKLAIQRNNSLHYGSDEGAKMAATCHSVISTVKLHGGSAGSTSGDFSKISLRGAGIISTWSLAESPWPRANVNFQS